VQNVGARQIVANQLHAHARKQEKSALKPVTRGMLFACGVKWYKDKKNLLWVTNYSYMMNEKQY